MRPSRGTLVAALLASFVDFSLHRIACVFFFPVSPPLQPTISCAGILCSTFADTTSDRSALRTEGLALSGLPNEGRSIRAAFFVPQIPALSSPAGRLGLIDHSESAARPRCLRIIENIIPERPTSANKSTNKRNSTIS